MKQFQLTIPALAILAGLSIAQDPPTQAGDAPSPETQAVSNEAASSEVTSEEAAPAPEAGEQIEQGPVGFESAAAKIQRDLEESVEELSALRTRIADEKIPLTKRLSGLEAELTQVRAELKTTLRTYDSRSLDLTSLQSEIKSREDETGYLANLLGEYIRNFESRLHIAELQRYEEPLEKARLAPENTNLAGSERSSRSPGGPRRHVARSSRRHPGRHALRRSRSHVQRPRERRAVRDGRPGRDLPVGRRPARRHRRAAARVPRADADSRSPSQRTRPPLRSWSRTVPGLIPLDTTLGNAHKVAATRKETFLEHVQDGGPVMYPLFGMAALALLIALAKWVGLFFVRKPSEEEDRLAPGSRSADRRCGGRARARAV